MTELQRDEVLCIPKRRRFVHSRLKSPEGLDVLHVFYGETEIVFDEPEFVPFGDKLIETERFRAEEAMGWSTGEPHAWERVREMLEALIEHEIVARVSDTNGARDAQAFPSTLGGGNGLAASEARAFVAHRDACPAITEEVFGRAIDLANLEVVVPVYRVAHAVLDRDGRQLGENNVTPRALFLDLPTERRVCKYAGSRYQAELPMNITALRHMTKRWPELLSLTEQFRTAFLARLGAVAGQLCVGDAHLLTVGCLASVGYVMVRGVEPVPNGELDAGLAAMFRLIDGVRLVTTDMMRTTAGEHGCDRPIDSRIVADYAERFTVYHGLHGVCAGPPALIDEYLRVLLDGIGAPIQVEPDVDARLGDLDAAIDYGLHGQRIEALIRLFGARQGLLYDRLQKALRGRLPATKLQEMMEQPITAQNHPLLREVHPLRETLELELMVDRWLYTRAAGGWPDGTPANGSIEQLFELDARALQLDQSALSTFLARVVPNEEGLTGAVRLTLASLAAEVFALERRCLRAVEAEQTALHARLRREPGRKLTGSDVALYTQPRTGPSLGATLAAALGISVVTDAEATVLSACGETLTLTA